MPKKTVILEKSPRNATTQVEQALTELKQSHSLEVTQLREQLTNVQAMFAKEDIGWLKINGDFDTEGLSLEDLQKWSQQIREAMAGNPHIKQGAELRSNYVWDGGIHYTGIPKEGRGRGANVQSIIDDPTCQYNFFDSEAKKKREYALYSDSIYVAIGEEGTKKIVQTIPLSQITGEVRNPRNSSEVWAYRFSYTDYDKEAQDQSVNEWYYVDRYVGNRPKTVKYIGKDEPVRQGYTAFDLKSNTQVGWPYGVPDALSALIWSRLYVDFVKNGKVMSDSMAAIAYKAVTATKKAGENASMKIGGGNAAGSTAVIGAANDLVPMSTAGKGYDFDSGRALLAVVATSLGLSTIALSSDAGAAGSSYGSASTLDLPVRMNIQARRQLHADYDVRVLKWMGAKDATATFDSLEDTASIYRAIQATMLKWGSGLYEAQEIREELDQLSGRLGKASIPDGVMLPNNINSWARADIDPKDGPATASNGGSVTPTQGSGTPFTDGSQNANDLRTDTLANAATKKLHALIEDFGKLVDEMESESAPK